MDPAGEPRPGDDGFDGFRMTLPENCVEYMVLNVGGKNEVSETHLPTLEKVRKAAAKKLSQLAKDYIWQRDGFSLETKLQNNLTYLHGITDFGDNVEDEWLIVFLLRQLSKDFPSLWIRVSDNDGEFLLIEAAKVLPKWLSPENDSMRVWIHEGKLFIIPLKATEEKAVSKPLALREAVDTIKSAPDSLLHSTNVEAEAFYRLEKYPGQISESLHYAVVTIPRKLAYILHERPKAIAPATEAFYLRDPVIVKRLLTPSYSLLFPPTDLVTVGIRFTKVLYAQLKSQRFEVMPAWGGLVQSTELDTDEDSRLALRKLAQLELGMKVTAGFEILAKDAHDSDNRLVREVALLLDDLEEEGDSSLPTDEEIGKWEDAKREDNDLWMDINYADFEHELSGQGRGKPKAKGSGFGNPRAEADLKKIVSRFESFLNDEDAGVDGIHVDEMDEDNDSDDEESEDEDKEVSLDEEQFSKMLGEMMGRPSENTGQKKDEGKAATYDHLDDPDSEANDEDDAEEIRKVMVQMESELSGLGVLSLEPTSKTQSSLQSRANPGDGGSNAGAEEEDDDAMDIDYNLAKNLLESFKSQAGMAGPAGNLLGLMGMTLPRDEECSDEEKK